ncbi:hypothetical protein CYMTET_23908, partial [Cymbomonas tetramitiformis]
GGWVAEGWQYLVLKSDPNLAQGALKAERSLDSLLDARNALGGANWSWAPQETIQIQRSPLSNHHQHQHSGPFGSVHPSLPGLPSPFVYDTPEDDERGRGRMRSTGTRTSSLSPVKLESLLESSEHEQLLSRQNASAIWTLPPSTSTPVSGTIRLAPLPNRGAPVDLPSDGQ